MVLELRFRFGSAPAEIEVSENQKPTGEGPFYVYVHRGPDGKIFYVGKGTRNRAWSTQRHQVWHTYVTERCGGKYSVQIVSYHGTSDEAEHAEDSLISRYGKQLVNWINTGRDFDYAASERFHALRNKNRLFVAETKYLEASDLEQAVARYKQAMSNMYEYESITLERGLVAELLNNTFQCGGGGISILNRLTFCLHRLGRYEELINTIDDFTRHFPAASKLSTIQPVLKRRDRARELLLEASC